MKVRELEGWPPQPGGSYKTSYTVPSSEESMIEKVVSVLDDNLCFTGTANGKQHTYDFKAPNEKVALTLKKVLEFNIGKSLFSVGDVELPMSDTPTLSVMRIDRRPAKFVLVVENKAFPHLSPNDGELTEQELRTLLADRYRQTSSQIEALIQQANEYPALKPQPLQKG